MSLQWIGQDDFAAGTLVGLGQDQQPAVGVERAINGVFDDDGDIWRRGAVVRRGTAPAPGPLTFIWSGYLGTDYVELVATATSMYAVQPDGDFVDLGGPGLPEPVQPAIVADLIFLPTGFVWGGSTKANYNTGTLTTTAGNSVVTGVGTAFIANVEPGMLLRGVAAGPGEWDRIKSVESDTSLTLDDVAPVSGAGFAYEIVAKTTDGLPATSRTRHLGTAGGRLVIATDNKIAFSQSGLPFTFDPTDYHELPDGAVVRGLASIRDRVLVFSVYGLWSITNMNFDLTDDFGNPQQELQRLTPEISLLHEAGLADWSGAIVAPCMDRVFLIDGLSPPISISDSIAPVYMSHIRAGHRVGGAKAFRSHYFLPFLDAAGVPVALYVCRLNRPVRARQVYYPWSEWRGYPAGVCALDVDPRTVPAFRAVHEDGWRLDLTASLPPFIESETPQIDPDEVPVEFDVETRDFPTGNGQPNHVRRLRLYYHVLGTGKIKAAYSYGDVFQRYQDVTATGDSYAQTAAKYPTYAALLRGESVDPEDLEWVGGVRYWIPLDAADLSQPGVDPLQWHLETAERKRYIRARFRSTDGVAQIKVRVIQFAVRPSAHQR